MLLFGMDMKVKKVIVIFYMAYLSTAVCLTVSLQYQSQIPQFLHNFIPYLDNNAQVLSLLCYKKDILQQVLKNAPFPITFGQTNKTLAPSDPAKNKLVFVIDLNCPNMTNILENSINSDCYSHPFRWIMFSYEKKPIPRIQALPDSNIFLVIPKGDKFEIRQFYKIDQNSSYIFERYGSWTLMFGLKTQQIEMVLSKRRQNLQKKMITSSMVITNNDTLNHLNDYTDKHIDSLTKINYLIIKILITVINASINFIPVDTWGYQNKETDEWNGMVGDMIRKTSDISGTSLFITTPRISKIDYLSLTSPTKVEFMFREPPLSYVANIYSLPFAASVWIFGVALVGLAVLVIFCSINFQRKLDFMNRSENNEFRYSDVLLLGISGVCQMGTLIQAKILSARISMVPTSRTNVRIFFLIAVLFFYTSYTANIVALLQSTTKSIQTLSDLLQSPLELAVEDTPYNRYYFPMATDPTRKAIYNKKVMSSDGVPKYMSVYEGMALLRKGLFAFHVELGLGYKIIEETFYEHEKCNLMNIPYIQATDPWFAAQKNLPYKEILKVNLFRIREYGLQGRENSRIFSKKPFCLGGGKSFESVRLIDCYVIFVILSIGYAASIFIFIIEQLLKKTRVGAFCLKL